ncbi:FKBP-type peptidyl-prolyl cis-trans isomerase, partial [bacterium]|nr:FKBP-type peptidyl-prolyl cis-trans isomerase [bacterium]
MANVKAGNTVKVHYTGSLDNGETFDSSVGREPLEFTLGEGKLLKKFEAAVDGMAVGDKVKINIPAAEGYGLRQKEMIQDINRDQVPPDLEPKVGMQLQMQTEQGYPVVVTVTAISETTLTLDANHRLADEDLNF